MNILHQTQCETFLYMIEIQTISIQNKVKKDLKKVKMQQNVKDHQNQFIIIFNFFKRKFQSDSTNQFPNVSFNSSHLTVCSILNFLLYEENFIFVFISVACFLLVIMVKTLWSSTCLAHFFQPLLISQIYLFLRSMFMINIFHYINFCYFCFLESDFIYYLTGARLKHMQWF